METQKPAIKRAAELLGGQSALARALQIRPQTVAQWSSGLRRVPDRHCVAVERLTDGGVRCEELRPDIDWSYLRGKRNPRRAKAA